MATGDYHQSFESPYMSPLGTMTIDFSSAGFTRRPFIIASARGYSFSSGTNVGTSVNVSTNATSTTSGTISIYRTASDTGSVDVIWLAIGI